MATQVDAPELSVVIPLLNEEEVLEQTYASLTKHLDVLGISYELVFVDDGSTDRSRAILAAKSLLDARVRVVALSRNFGHEMATTAGIHHARGRAVVIIDADLQDPPEVIAEFVAKWREGYQVVYGVRRERKGETLLKKATSFLFYRLMSRIADTKIPKDTGDFRLIDRRVIDVYSKLSEDPRFFRGLISWIGFKQVGVPFVRDERAAGRTKYRYARLIKLAFDTITAFSTFPSLCITLTAGGLAAGSIGVATLLVALAIAGVVAVPAWGWVALAFLGLFNVQFLSLAVLGEYVVRTHRHTQQRPLYVVDRVIEGEQVQHEPPTASARFEHFPQPNTTSASAHAGVGTQSLR